MNSVEGSNAAAAGIGRRLLSAVYECVLLFAIAFIASLPFHGAADTDLGDWNRHAFQLYLFLVFGLYFHWCWLRGGQTLPMKTWKLKLVNRNGEAVGISQCLLRYAAAWLSIISLGAGFLWAVFDRDRQFFHDRLAGTRIINVE